MTITLTINAFFVAIVVQIVTFVGCMVGAARADLGDAEFRLGCAIFVLGSIVGTCLGKMLA